MKPRALVFGAVIFAALPFGSVVHADGGAFCETLADGLVFGSEPRAVTVAGLGEAKCTWSRGLSGTRALTCGWPFAYRAAEATTAFERLSGDVAACASPAETPQAGVNHPDSYDLRLFTLEGSVVAVSLKDKGALSATYVFLRMETRAD